MTPTKLDVRGEICPYPMMRTVSALKKLSGDERALEVVTDHPPALETIPTQAARLGFRTVLEQLTQMLEQAQQLEALTPVQKVAPVTKPIAEPVIEPIAEPVIEPIAEVQEQAAEPETIWSELGVWVGKHGIQIEAMNDLEAIIIKYS